MISLKLNEDVFVQMCIWHYVLDICPQMCDSWPNGKFSEKLQAQGARNSFPRRQYLTTVKF